MKKRLSVLKKVIFGLSVTVMLGACFMSPAFTYRSEATGFSEEDLEFLARAGNSLQSILEEKEIMALVYLTDYYDLRVEPDGASVSVGRVASGQQVRIRDIVMTEKQEVWVKVSCIVRGESYIGYVNRQNLACSDESFLNWEQEYDMNPVSYQTMLLAEADTDTDTDTEENSKAVYEDIEQFPESYQEALLALKQEHPNWTFVKMNTELKWDTVVEEELKSGRSLVYGSNVTAMKEGLYGQNWYYASEEALEYYLDPRNGLTQDRIFQFEQLTYNESYHTESAVQSFLDNTFMSGNIPQTEMTFAYGFTAIGKAEEINISPFHLASRVYQEQGDGDSALISGTYEGYEGYYNYYNIGATGKTDKEVIENGLAYAKEQNWDSPYNSLHFGAKIIGANYIAKGQDTLYLQKFDVDSSDGELYWHQYMQNIGAPFSEAVNIKKLYESAGSLDNTFVFKIPVYEDMPESACEKPTVSNRVVLDMLEGYDSLQVYLDGKAVTAVERNGYYIAEAADDLAKTAVMYQYNEKGVPEGMAVWTLSHDGSGYVVKEIEGLRDILSYHGFSVRITGRSGIRYKSGISQEAKALLTGEGIDGYTVKEYGTLLLPKTLLGEDMLTLSTEKVRKGLSYGADENGKPVDKVLEQVDRRDRFASVLVGLPVGQYKTVFTFRSYMILTGDAEEIVVYGPQNEKSIYDLAKQILAAKAYPEGSSPDVFLRQLISDADAYTETSDAEAGTE